MKKEGYNHEAAVEPGSSACAPALDHEATDEEHLGEDSSEQIEDPATLIHVPTAMHAPVLIGKRRRLQEGDAEDQQEHADGYAAAAGDDSSTSRPFDDNAGESEDDAEMQPGLASFAPWIPTADPAFSFKRIKCGGTESEAGLLHDVASINIKDVFKQPSKQQLDASGLGQGPNQQGGTGWTNRGGDSCEAFANTNTAGQQQASWLEVGHQQWQLHQQEMVEHELDDLPTDIQQLTTEGVWMCKSRVIAYGGFSTIYSCNVKDMRCVMKLAHAGVPIASNFQELKHLQKIQGHANVLQLVGVAVGHGLGDGRPGIVTKAMAGGPLSKALVRYREERFGKGLEVTPDMQTLEDKLVIIGIALQIMNGLQHMLDCQQSHCDIKGSNVLISRLKLLPSGDRLQEEPQVALGDLGLSRTLTDGLLSNSVKGTDQWMAPEVLAQLYPIQPVELRTWNLLADTQFTWQVDVWSTGVVLWELTTMFQHLPYGSNPDSSVFTRIRDGQLTPTIPEGCDAVWRSIMQDCWDLDPAKRSTFQQLINRTLQYRCSLINADAEQP